jgi:hypothetical protein
MKTTGEIMCREWEYPTHSFRAIDKDGEDCYYQYKPHLRNNNVFWLPSRGDFLEAPDLIDQDWASDNWENSLQSYADYYSVTTIQQP